MVSWYQPQNIAGEAASVQSVQNCDDSQADAWPHKTTKRHHLRRSLGEDLEFVRMASHVDNNKDELADSDASNSRFSRYGHGKTTQ